MAQHGNRSEKHEVEIRHAIDERHLEYNLEEEGLHKAVEKYNEDKAEARAQERASGHLKNE